VKRNGRCRPTLVSQRYEMRWPRRSIAAPDIVVCACARSALQEQNVHSTKYSVCLQLDRSSYVHCGVFELKFGDDRIWSSVFRLHVKVRPPLGIGAFISPAALIDL
jgi:hypothetical protein